ncbi:MAG: sulfurtransferase TusA family protein [Ignisphaera sp.]
MKVLDFRGEECPHPLVKTVRELSKARKGEEIIVLTTSKLCVDMIKESVEAFNIGEINICEKNGYYEIRLRKTVEF